MIKILEEKNDGSSIKGPKMSFQKQFSEPKAQTNPEENENLKQKLKEKEAEVEKLVT